MRKVRKHLINKLHYPTPGCENQWIWAVVSKGVDTTGPNLHIGYNTLICIYLYYCSSESVRVHGIHAISGDTRFVIDAESEWYVPFVWFFK